MALKLRRGNNAQRVGITFAEGELVYTTDTKKLYVGDGSAAGGNLVSGMNNLVEDVTPQLGGNLDLNGNDITGTGNVNITGSLTIGSGFLAVDTKGSVFANDSGLLVDGINGKLVLANNLISDIGNVDTASPNNGNVLAWNSSTSKWTPTDYDLTAQPINELSDVNAGSPQDKQALVWDSATSKWIAGDVVQQGEFLDGDFRGSLFGDDSTLVVDGITNTVTASSINADTINSTSGVFRLNGPSSGVFTKIIKSNGDRYFLELNRTDNSVIKGTNSYCGAIKFSQTDVNETFATGYISSKTNYLAFGHHTTSTENDIDASGWMVLQNGKLTVGYGLTPGTEQLNVYGNTLVTGFVQFGSFTTAQRNALTAANGMVIYNSTTNKFQGRANGAWVDLH